jgi:hypothetical protein
MGKWTGKTLSKEVKTANKYMKKCSTFLHQGNAKLKLHGDSISPQSECLSFWYVLKAVEKWWVGGKGVRESTQRD